MSSADGLAGGKDNQRVPPTNNERLDDTTSTHTDTSERTTAGSILKRLMRSVRRTPSGRATPDNASDRSPRRATSFRHEGSVRDAAAAALPPPPDDELDEMFQRVLCDTLGEEAAAAAARRHTSREAKWHMVLAAGSGSGGRAASAGPSSPAAFIARLQRASQRAYAPTPLALATGMASPRQRQPDTPAFLDIALVRALRMQLAGQPLSWVREFVDLGGTAVVAECLRDASTALAIARRAPSAGGTALGGEAAAGIDAAVAEWLRVLRAFTNSTAGLESAARSKGLLAAVCALLAAPPATAEPELRSVPLHVLTVACYADPPSSALLVLNALSTSAVPGGTAQKHAESRYDALVSAVAEACRDHKAAPSSKAHASAAADGLMLVNALLENIDDAATRVHVRSALWRRPLRPAADALRNNDTDPAVLRQLAVFDEACALDADLLLGHDHNEGMDTAGEHTLDDGHGDPSHTFDDAVALAKRFVGEDKHEVASLLAALLSIRSHDNGEARARYARMLSRVLASVHLAGRGLDPDWAASPIPVVTVDDLQACLADAGASAALRTRLADAEAALASRDAQLATLRLALDESRAGLIASEHALEATRQALETSQQTLERTEETCKSLRESLHAACTPERVPALRRLSTASECEQWPDLASADESTSPNAAESNSDAPLSAPPPPPPMPKRSTKTPSVPSSPIVLNDGDDSKPAALNVPPPPPMPFKKQSAPPAPPMPKTHFDKPSATALPPPPPPMPQKHSKGAHDSNPPANVPLPPPPPPPPAGGHSKVPSVTVLAPQEQQSPATDGVSYPTPSARLKPMQWKKLLAREVPGTLWEGMDVRRYDGRVRFDEIDRLFASVDARGASAHAKDSAQKDSQRTHSANADDSPAARVAAVLSVDDKMLLSIVLSKVPHDEDALASALASMDASVLTPRLCAQLRRCLDDERVPSAALAALVALNGCIDGLADRAERVVVRLAAVPGFAPRLRVLGARADFSDAAALCSALLAPFEAAFAAVRTSERLRSILALVLYVGNYVNQDTPRGAALGFRVEYVAAIKPLRGSVPGTSMLGFLAATLAREFPDVLPGALRDLAPLSSARTLRFADAEEKAAELSRCIDAAASAAEQYRAAHADDAFGTKTAEAIADMERQRSATLAHVDALRAERAALMAYFAEGPAAMAPEALLGMLSEFAADLEAARVAALPGQTGAARSRRSSVTAAIADRGEHRGVMDHVLASLRGT